MIVRASFCRRVFNQGLPEQFAFVTTFRNRQPINQRWHLIRITDTQNQPQFAVGLDPTLQTIEFSILKYDRTLQTLTWEQPQVRNWKDPMCLEFLPQIVLLL